MTTMTTHEFDPDAARVVDAAQTRPVFVTESGQPTRVLLTIEDCWRLTGTKSPAEALAHQASADFEFEPASTFA
jgi:hypothetical protein